MRTGLRWFLKVLAAAVAVLAVSAAAGLLALQERRAPGNESRMAASPEALLGRQEVARVQQALAGKGLLGEHRQGELDGPTTEAVRRFQQQRGLAATGVPDRETLRELGMSAERAYGPERRSRG